MAEQFIVNEKGERIAVIISISEYEDLLHKRHLIPELTEDYKTMIDKMLDDERNGMAQYVSYQKVKERFLR